jgi:hypothetical protein
MTFRFPAAVLLLSSLLSASATHADSCSQHVTSLLRDQSPRLKSLLVGRYPKGDVKVLEPKLVLADGEALNRLSQDPDLKMSYVIAPDDRLYLVEGDVDFDPDRIWMADLERDGGQPWRFPVKSGGRFRFVRDNPERAAGSFSLENAYGAELSDEEIATFSELVDETIRSKPALAKRMKLQRARSAAQVMKCSEAFAEGRSAKQFIGSKVFVSSTMLTGGIIINHPERFDVLLQHVGLHDRQEGRDYDGDMLLADYSSTALNSFFQAYVGYHISAKGVKFLENRIGSKVASSLLARGAASMASVGLQSLMYAALTDNDAKGVGLYNVGYSVVSIGKSHLLDNFMYQKLPKLIYEACLVNPALKIVVGQKTVRFVEGFASTTLYLKGREVFVGE